MKPKVAYLPPSVSPACVSFFIHSTSISYYHDCYEYCLNSEDPLMPETVETINNQLHSHGANIGKIRDKEAKITIQWEDSRNKIVPSEALKGYQNMKESLLNREKHGRLNYM